MSSFYSFITKEVIENVRERYNITEEEIKLKIVTIQDWLKEQKHLPQIILDNDHLIERFLLNNKFDIDKTKGKIDSHYTVKRKYYQFVDADDTFLPSKEFGIFVSTNCFTPQYEQIIIVRQLVENKIDGLRCFQSFLVSCELNFLNSYSTGNIYIIDCNATSLSVWREFGFSRTVQFIKYYLGSSYGRLTQVNFINVPYVLGMIMRLLQPFIKAKIFNRFTFHNDLESLYKAVPRNLLPKDYGGDQISIDESIELLDKLVENNRALIRDVKVQITNEELRNS